MLNQNKYFFVVLCAGIIAASTLEVATSPQRPLLLESIGDSRMAENETAVIPSIETYRPDFCGRKINGAILEEMRQSSK